MSSVNSLVQIANVAGRALLGRDRQGDVAAFSGEQTTPADVFSERIIQAHLVHRFPEIPYYQKGPPVLEGRTFIVDPIDGTGNYLMCDTFWGVSIALVQDGRTVMGVVRLPALDELFWSEAGGEHSPLRLTSTPRLQGAHVWFDQNWIKMSAGGVNVLQRLVDVGALPQIRRCCTASMMWVATGRIDAFIHTQPKPCDIAAAGLIVEMAGGRVTDMQGNPWHPFSTSIVASNGLIHDELLELLSTL